MNHRNGKQSHYLTVALPPVALGALGLWLGSTPVAAASHARHTRHSAHPTPSVKSVSATNAAPQTALEPSLAREQGGRYLPLDTLQKLRAQRGEPGPAMQPLYQGKALKGLSAQNLLTDPVFAVAGKTGGAGVGVRLAQAIPNPVPPTVRPARIARRGAAPLAPPRWVRYPLEFQLCGISLGTRAVDKDRFNRIDRYGLFSMHGNPTAVIVPVFVTGGGGGGGEGGSGGGGGGTAGAAGGGAASSLVLAGLTVQQRPPLAGADLFPQSQNGYLAHWASAVAVRLDNNHVEWLYNRGTYAMGFVVDRLGYVDAVVVAGIESPIARTQLEDPVHTVKLGDDLRKVLYRYGYPDTIETYIVSSGAISGGGGGGGGGGEGGSGGGPGGGGSGGSGGSGGGGGSSGGGGAAGGGGGGGRGVIGGPPGAPGLVGPGPSTLSGGAAPEEPTGVGSSAPASGNPTAGGFAGNAAFRTFEFRYEQSYNVVFTIRFNRVVRIYIFGDPDFFNDPRRQLFRTSY